jgi:hypothetical protein
MASRKPGRPRGTPKTGGRQKGTPNKVTVEARQAASEMVNDPFYRRRLLRDLRQRKVAPAVEAMLWYYAHGKPKEIVAHEGGIAVRWLEPGEDPSASDRDA